MLIKTVKRHGHVLMSTFLLSFFVFVVLDYVLVALLHWSTSSVLLISLYFLHTAMEQIGQNRREEIATSLLPKEPFIELLFFLIVGLVILSFFTFFAWALKVFFPHWGFTLPRQGDFVAALMGICVLVSYLPFHGRSGPQQDKKIPFWPFLGAFLVAKAGQVWLYNGKGQRMMIGASLSLLMVAASHGLILVCNKRASSLLLNRKGPMPFARCCHNGVSPLMRCIVLTVPPFPQGKRHADAENQ